MKKQNEMDWHFSNTVWLHSIPTQNLDHWKVQSKCRTFMDHSANVCYPIESHTSPFSNPFSKDLGTSVKFKQISLDFSDRIRDHLIYGPLKTCTWNSVMMKLETILNKCQLRLQLELTLNWVVSVLCTLCSCV